MIRFTVFSNDPQIPSDTVTLYFEEFLIGENSKCDLRLPDSTHSPTIIKVKAIETGLMLTSKESDHFWIEGKKVSGTKKVTLKQHIKVGETTIELSEYIFASVNKSLDISGQYEKFTTEKDEYTPVLEGLEKEVLYAEDHPITPKAQV